MCKTLIIYDSSFGNTQKVAKAMAAVVAKPDCVTVKPVRSVNIDDIDNADLVVIGSPTHGGQPTVPMQEFFKGLPGNSLASKQVAAFDTRFAIDQHGVGLHILMRSIGFAAPKIAKKMQALGGQLAVKPQGFIVEDKKGPMSPGELARAADWASQLVSKTKQRSSKAQQQFQS